MYVNLGGTQFQVSRIIRKSKETGQLYDNIRLYNGYSRFSNSIDLPPKIMEAELKKLIEAIQEMGKK